jgi:hypothetical protein
MITQAHIDALDQAIADGVRSVTVGGDTTTYNTTTSLIAARDDLIRRKAEQDRVDAGRARRTGRTYLHYAGRGY